MNAHRAKRTVIRHVMKLLPLIDQFNRPLHDLRISVTDRCNFRCRYCMPREVFGPQYHYLRQQELLTFEEITRIASLFSGLGVTKIRLTGGEPLLRRDLDVLVHMLSSVSGIVDVAMTTNGALLAAQADALRKAGLNRVTVSLDAIDEVIFQQMNDAEFSAARVLQGINTAAKVGLSPIKVNMVVQRGVNDCEVLALAEQFRHTPVVLRFIEYMDVGNTNNWKLPEVVPSAEIVEIISQRWALEPVQPRYFGEVASRYTYKDGAGEIGVISSVTAPFCGSCTRARLSSDGKLFTCLFGSDGVDLRTLVRGDGTDDDLRSLISSVWTRRSDKYSETRSAEGSSQKKVEMSRIGG